MHVLQEQARLSKLMSKPYQIGNTTGAVVGSSVADPASMAYFLKQAKRGLLAIGAESLTWKVGDRLLVDVLCDIAKALKWPIVATGHAYKEVSARMAPAKVVSMNLLDLVNHLKDSEWKGLDGQGQYDLFVTGGHLVYLVSQAFSTLKNFASKSKLSTASLDFYYHPNARFSLPNLDNPEEWRAYLDKVLAAVQGETASKKK